MSRLGNHRTLTTAQVAFVLAILAIGSKALGFIREMILADYYGTSYVVDAYNLAGAIPSMLFAGVLGATATSFIPLFSQKQEKEGTASGDLLTSQTINILVVISIASSLVGIFFSEQLVTIFTTPFTSAPAGINFIERIGWFLTHGWTGVNLELTSFYVKITFSFCLFSTVGGILESYLKYKNIFIRPMLSNYALNIATIAFYWISNVNDDPRLIVFGGFVGNAIRMFIIIFIAKNERFRYIFDFHLTDTVKMIFALAFPVFLGTMADQINMFVDKSLASGLREGSIAALGYGGLLSGLIGGLSTSVIGTILYPRMAQAYALNDNERFANLFTRGLTVILIIGLPFMLGSLLYSKDLVQIIYERGAFGATSVDMTAIAYFYYSISLVFGMTHGFIISAFFSRHNTRTPLIVSACCVVVNITANLLLIGPLAHGGLALGTSIATITNVTILLIILRRNHPYLIQRAFVQRIAYIAVVSIISVAATWPLFYFSRVLADTFTLVLPRMVQLGGVVIVSSIIYILLLRKLHISELSLLKSMLLFRDDSLHDE